MRFGSKIKKQNRYNNLRVIYERQHDYENIKLRKKYQIDQQIIFYPTIQSIWLEKIFFILLSSTYPRATWGPTSGQRRNYTGEERPRSNSINAFTYCDYLGVHHISSCLFSKFLIPVLIAVLFISEMRIGSSLSFAKAG